MKYDYDMIVIGAGAGGLNIAMFMVKAGFKTLIIDKSDRSIGGDCLNYGCVPSKALIHVSRMVHDGKESKKFGVGASGSVDMKKVREYVRSKVEHIRKHENAAYLRSKGLDVALGKATFVGSHEVKVDGKVYSGKKIMLATGSRPRVLNIPGIDKVDYLTNETIFDVERLPKRLLIIGGGPIGMELGQAFRRLGSEVTVLEKGDKFLPKETPEMAAILLKQLKKEGVAFHFNSEPKKFLSGKKVLVQSLVSGKEKEISFDACLLAAGRILNIDGLGLENAGIELDESGHKLKVDSYLRTTNKNVYVCGDVAGSYQFTHAAELHAGVLIRNFFSPFKKKVNYDHLSWVTYTTPEIATFGLSEKELSRRGVAYEKLSYDFKDDDRSIVDDWTDGKVVMFVSKKGKLLGGSMVAINAGELFQELVLANSSGLGIGSLFGKIYPYPTASRVNKRVVSLHFAKKLTPFVKKVFKWLY